MWPLSVFCYAMRISLGSNTCPTDTERAAETGWLIDVYTKEMLIKTNENAGSIMSKRLTAVPQKKMITFADDTTTSGLIKDIHLSAHRQELPHPAGDSGQVDGLGKVLALLHVVSDCSQPALVDWLHPFVACSLQLSGKCQIPVRWLEHWKCVWKCVSFKTLSTKLKLERGLGQRDCGVFSSRIPARSSVFCGPSVQPLGELGSTQEFDPSVNVVGSQWIGS